MGCFQASLFHALPSFPEIREAPGPCLRSCRPGPRDPGPLSAYGHLAESRAAILAGVAIGRPRHSHQSKSSGAAAVERAPRNPNPRRPGFYAAQTGFNPRDTGLERVKAVP